uniref:BolA protein (Pfam PF01722) n=1 Tax=uncultured eukaryote TaxID=100272 RepID=K7ZV05_9EUKA|nr:BolA protein (pfam PF01722) [uncultured eukaryote]
MSGIVQTSIEKKLNEKFAPAHLEVINESYMHSVPKGSETHFKVVIVSDKFVDVSLIDRHRQVNALLNDELKNGVHALSIQAKTVEQWEKSGGKVSQSPACMGGMAKEKKKEDE